MSAILKRGQRMRDGTIYVGISPDSGKKMFTTPADAPLTYTFNRAREYATKLCAHEHKDWRVPSDAELDVLWKNRNRGALRGTFHQVNSDPALDMAAWYWSSKSTVNAYGWAQRFLDGFRAPNRKGTESSLRCVR